jgi:hypothetical protein
MAQQPEVLTWLERELDGATQLAGVELAARYFATTERWGQRMPPLEHTQLNRELTQQVLRIDPPERWILELPIDLDHGDKRSLGRVLRALVTVSQARL